MSWLRLLDLLCLAVWHAYFWSSLIVRIARGVRPNFDRSLFVRIRAELKPFVLPAVIGGYVVDAPLRQLDWSDGLTLALNLLLVWMYHKDEDDDDRWKRRRKKLVERVAEVGGRLQVVPQGAS